jgi:hypothetical protein
MIKKIIFLPPRTTTTTRTQKKNTLPKKLERKKKAEIPEKKLKGTAQKRKTNRKNKITGL